MKLWRVTMKVDGREMTQVIPASSISDAQDIFRKMYSGHQTVLIKTVPC